MLGFLTKLLGIRVMRLDEIKPVELTTPRLRLRSFRTFDDWPRYHEYHRDPEVIRHLAKRPDTDAKLRAALKAHAVVTSVLPRHLHFGIQEADDSRLLGEVHVVPEPSRGERGFLGFVLHRDAWGRGIATEAATRLVDHAFRVAGYAEVWAGCTRENERSHRVLEKIGLAATDEKVAFPGEPAGAETLAFRADRESWLRRRRDRE